MFKGILSFTWCVQIFSLFDVMLQIFSLFDLMLQILSLFYLMSTDILFDLMFTDILSLTYCCKTFPPGCCTTVVHLPAITVIWVQSPADVGWLFFLTSMTLGSTQPSKICATQSSLYSGKERWWWKGTGHPTLCHGLQSV